MIPDTIIDIIKREIIGDPMISTEEMIVKLKGRQSLLDKRLMLLREAERQVKHMGRTIAFLASNGTEAIADLRRCNLCGYIGLFDTFGITKRAHAKCPGCGSFERTRFVFLLLERLGYLDKTKCFLEIAPSPSSYSALCQRLGARYEGVDLFPELLWNKGLKKVKKLDLCDPPFDLGTYDVIINLHVMEHVRCDPVDVIGELNKHLAPGGIHVLSVPFGGDTTIEDMDPTLSEEVRTRLYGHPDHMRTFGHVDFPAQLQQVFGSAFHEVDYSSFLQENDMTLSLGRDLTQIKKTNRLFWVDHQR